MSVVSDLSLIVLMLLLFIFLVIIALDYRIIFPCSRNQELYENYEEMYDEMKNYENYEEMYDNMKNYEEMYDYKFYNNILVHDKKKENFVGII
jgi:hypothetical protein